MRYALSVPNLGGYGDPGVVIDLAETAEQAGWDGFFVWDHMLLNRARSIPVLDPWVLLAGIACHTRHITLGPLVTPLARRRPWKVARETVTLDHLSGGRTVLGVGLGAPVEDEFGVFGEVVDDRARADLLDEGLDVIAALWSGAPVGHRGTHYRVDPVTFLPRPLRQPRIPVWVAAKWPARRPVRRAARWDGLVAMKAGNAYHETLGVGEIDRIMDLVRAHRAGSTPFDLVLSAMNSWPDSTSTDSVEAYARAGVTWWLEVLHPFTVEPALVRRLVARGPGPLRA